MFGYFIFDSFSGNTNGLFLVFIFYQKCINLFIYTEIKWLHLKLSIGVYIKTRLKIASDYGYGKNNHVATMPQPQFISQLASTLNIEDRA